MQIDWITVSAQIINFLILVWLLKRFLYQPVIKAMEVREQGIAEQIEQAKRREQQAEEQRQQFQEKTQDFLQQRESLFEQAKDEAAQEKRQLLADARDEVSNTRHHWQQQVSQEKDEFFTQLRSQSSEIIQATITKALGDLANTALEQQMVEVFIARLNELDESVRNDLRQANETVCIASVFELSKPSQAALRQAIHNNIAADLEVDFVLLPELLCGIELTCGGRRLSWNLADYMEGLSKRIEETFAPLESAD